MYNVYNQICDNIVYFSKYLLYPLYTNQFINKDLLILTTSSSNS